MLAIICHRYYEYKNVIQSGTSCVCVIDNTPDPYPSFMRPFLVRAIQAVP